MDFTTPLFYLDEDFNPHYVKKIFIENNNKTIVLDPTGGIFFDGIPVVGENSGVDPRVGVIEGKVNVLEPKVTNIEEEINVMKPRITTLETKNRVMETTIATNSTKISVLDEKVSTLESNDSITNGKILVLDASIVALEGKVSANETSIGALETTVVNNKANIFTLDGKVSTVETSISSMETSINFLETSVSANTTRITNLEVSSHESMEPRVVVLEGKVSVLETSVGSLETSVGSLETSVGSLETSVGSLETEITEVKADGAGNSARISTLETSIGVLETEVTSIKPRVSTLEATATNNAFRLSVLENKVDFVDGRVITLENTYTSLITDVADLKPRVSILETGAVALSAKVISLETITSSLSTSIFSLKDNEVIVGNRLDTAETNISTLEIKNSGVTTRVTTLETQVGNLETGAITTSGQVSSLETKTGILETKLGTVIGEVNTLGVNATALNTRVSALEPRVEALEVKDVTIEANVSANTSGIANHETRIITLESKVSVVEPKVSTLEGKVSVLEPKVSSLEMEVAVVTPKITTLEEKVAIAEPVIAANSVAISTLEPKVATLETALFGAITPRVTTLETEMTGITPRVSTLETGLGTVTSRVTTLETTTAGIRTDVDSNTTRIFNLENVEPGVPVVLPYWALTDNIDFGTGKTKIEANKVTLHGPVEITTGELTTSINSQDLAAAKEINVKFSDFTPAAPLMTAKSVYWDSATERLKFTNSAFMEISLPSYLGPTSINMEEDKMTLDKDYIVFTNGTNNISVSSGAINATSSGGTATLNQVKLLELDKFSGRTSVPSSFDRIKALVTFDTTTGVYTNSLPAPYLESNSLNFSGSILDKALVDSVAGFNGFANVVNPTGVINEVIYNTTTGKFGYTVKTGTAPYVKQLVIDMSAVSASTNTVFVDDTSFGFSGSDTKWNANSIVMSNSTKVLKSSTTIDGFLFTNAGPVTIDNPSIITLQRAQLAALARLVNATSGISFSSSKLVSYNTLTKDYVLLDVPAPLQAYLKESTIEMDSLTISAAKIWSTSGLTFDTAVDSGVANSGTRLSNGGIYAFSSTDSQNGIRYTKDGIFSLPSATPVFSLTRDRLSVLANIGETGTVTGDGDWFSVIKSTSGVKSYVYKQLFDSFKAIKTKFFDFTNVGDKLPSNIDVPAPVINRTGVYFPVDPLVDLYSGTSFSNDNLKIINGNQSSTVTQNAVAVVNNTIGVGGTLSSSSLVLSGTGGTTVGTVTPTTISAVNSSTGRSGTLSTNNLVLSSSSGTTTSTINPTTITVANTTATQSGTLSSTALTISGTGGTTTGTVNPTAITIANTSTGQSGILSSTNLTLGGVAIGSENLQSLVEYTNVSNTTLLPSAAGVYSGLSASNGDTVLTIASGVNGILKRTYVPRFTISKFDAVQLSGADANSTPPTTVDGVTSNSAIYKVNNILSVPGDSVRLLMIKEMVITNNNNTVRSEMFAIALPYGLKLTDMNVIPNATVSGFSSGSSVLATPQGASNVIATVTAATLSRAIVGYSGTDCIIVKLLWNRVGGVIFNRVNVCIELNITRNGFIDVASTFGY